MAAKNEFFKWPEIKGPKKQWLENPKIDIFKDQEFNKTAPDIIAMHNSLYPEYQASFRNRIEAIVWLPFIKVSVLNEEIKSYPEYKDLTIAKHIASRETMQAGNNVDYRREYRPI